MRSDWTDLPAETREAIEAQTGPIHRIRPAPTGNHANIASTVDAADGRLFVKAAWKVSADTDGPEVRSLRWEAAINPYVTAYAPRLLWTVEAGGWLALGFEHVEGRHADYTPGSADLDLLAKVIDTFQAMHCPQVLGDKRVERRWVGLADDVSPMAGDAMLHADLNPANLLVTADGRVYVVDWAFACRGAAWVEMGLLIPWLLKAGHSPADAEKWVSQFPSWAAADSADIDLFSRVFAERWRRHALRDEPEDWVVLQAEATKQWADHRWTRRRCCWRSASR
jgi:hypothetical protein